jgi:hypothetical protein
MKAPYINGMLSIAAGSVFMISGASDAFLVGWIIIANVWFAAGYLANTARERVAAWEKGS